MELSLGFAFRTALRWSLVLTSALTGVTIATNVHAQTPASGTAGPVRTTPPDVRTGLRLPEIQLHDPWILADRSTRTYYLYFVGVADGSRAVGANSFERGDFRRRWYRLT